MASTVGERGQVTIEKAILYCFMYDPIGAKYVIVAKNVMRLGGAITAPHVDIARAHHLHVGHAGQRREMKGVASVAEADNDYTKRRSHQNRYRVSDAGEATPDDTLSALRHPGFARRTGEGCRRHSRP